MIPSLSIYRNSHDTTGVRCSLDAIYSRIKTGAKGLLEKTQTARQYLTESPAKYKRFKENHLPAPTFSGVFPAGKRKAQHLEQHSGLVVLDIDDRARTTITDLLAELAHRPDIVLAFISPSSTGIKKVVRVSPTPQNAAEHVGAYQAVVSHFYDLTEAYDFVYDESGKDCSRMCYLAHHPQVIYNPDAIPIAWDRDAHIKELQRLAEEQAQRAAAFRESGFDVSALDYIDPDCSYAEWMAIGFACYNSGVPLAIWDEWSRQGQSYKAGEPARKWDTFAGYTGVKRTWASVIYTAMQNGYVPPARAPKSKPLVIDTAASNRKQAELPTNSETRTQLDCDVRAALDRPPSPCPDYTILCYDTGTGKSHTTLANAKRDGKKVLSLLGNHNLAAQQEETAAKLDFLPYRFKGRGYNFDQTPLSHLPARTREQDTDIFEKYPVMCAFYDVVEKYTAKRLSPMHVCGGCPFLQQCPYWQQYADMRQSDYVSICRQDLIFNPDMRTFLSMITDGKVPFEKKSDESDIEAAIGAALGLDSEPPTSFEKFDFAIIDDYTVSGLYTDVTYTLEELATLRDNWKSTETGDFFSELFNALIFAFDKSGTQKLIDLLTSLFQSTPADVLARVNENLTKHPYKDGDGAIEPISPSTALSRGIGLENLSPVWHHRDWTILHQLQAILAHTKNAAQAPIFARPDGKAIELSIPPQPPPAIRKVFFLSATADIERTKAAFGEHEINWDVKVGNQPRLASGVLPYQYVDARMTAGGIFELQRDASGNVMYDADKKPIRTGKLTSRAREILLKICELVRADGRKSVFTSYKEFYSGDFLNLPEVQQLHEVFDHVLHYDIASGQNFDDCRIFISFGQPKAEPKTVEKVARIQHAHASEPLSFEYEQTTETTDGYTSTAHRYTDTRVEAVRQQLTRDKSKQTLGRGRATLYTDSVILHISAEPVPSFTEFATPVSYKQLIAAESLSSIGASVSCGERAHAPVISTAEKIGQLKEEHPAITQTEIAKRLGITQSAVSQALSSNVVKDTAESSDNLYDVTLQRDLSLKGQILCYLQEQGEARTAAILAEVIGNPTAIKNELKRLLSAGKIYKVRHGVYATEQNPCQAPTAEKTTQPLDTENLPAKTDKSFSDAAEVMSVIANYLMQFDNKPLQRHSPQFTIINLEEAQEWSAHAFQNFFWSHENPCSNQLVLFAPNEISDWHKLKPT